MKKKKFRERNEPYAHRDIDSPFTPFAYLIDDHLIQKLRIQFIIYSK